MRKSVEHITGCPPAAGDRVEVRTGAGRAIQRNGTVKRRVLQRRVRLSGSVVQWLRDPARTSAERLAFAALVLELDWNPVGSSTAVLARGAPPGMRWASFGAYRVIFIWNLPANEVRFLVCC